MLVTVGEKTAVEEEDEWTEQQEKEVEVEGGVYKAMADRKSNSCQQGRALHGDRVYPVAVAWRECCYQRLQSEPQQLQQSDRAMGKGGLTGALCEPGVALVGPFAITKICYKAVC